MCQSGYRRAAGEASGHVARTLLVCLRHSVMIEYYAVRLVCLELPWENGVVFPQSLLSAFPWKTKLPGLTGLETTKQNR